jgi:type II secretory pathway pseudopilin PulG
MVARGENTRTQVGFTVIELLVSLILFTTAMTLTAIVSAGYQTRTAAQRAAQVFATDLSYARSSAVRSRERVVVDFDVASVSYVVRQEGDTLLWREFDRDDEIRLDWLDLNLTGDSLVFDTRGVGDLSGAGSSLGLASFAAGEAVYDVSFNVMGASKVDAR